jgi:hypothetical protein
MILNYIFIKLTNNKFKFFIEFFLINNNCVNAKFLSRYISRKLKQNYPIKELINPIKKDLLYVIKLSIIPKKSYNKILNKKDIIFFNNKTINKFLFKNIIIILIKNYNITLYKYFKLTHIFLNLDLFFINNLLNNELNKFEKIKITLNYFQKKIIYIYFFENNNNLFLSNQLFIPKIIKYIKLINVDKLYKLNNLINNYIFIGNFNILNNLYNINLYNLNLKLIRLACINFNKYLKFNYFIYQIYLNNKYNN